MSQSHEKLPTDKVKNIVALLDLDEKGIVLSAELTQHLLDAFKSSGIQEIYLFTRMQYLPYFVSQIKSRVKELQQHGFTVSGVITSADVDPNIEEKEKKPGIAYVQAATQEKALFLDTRSKTERAIEEANKYGKNVDSCMLDLSIKFFQKQESFEACAIFSCKKDFIEEIKNQHKDQRIVRAIAVDEKYKKESKNSRHYHCEIFGYSELEAQNLVNKRERLLDSIDRYLRYLEDQNDSSTEKKIKVLKEMLSKLSLNKKDLGIEEFRICFNKNKNILEERRDSGYMIFLKTIVTILSLGIAAAFGLWSVHGRKVCEEMNKTLETKSSLFR